MTPAPPGAPIYELQLDDREPVRTSLAEHTFTGLAPGAHTLWVQLVDANYVPVPGTRVQVQVRVATPPPAASQPQPAPPQGASH